MKINRKRGLAGEGNMNTNTSYCNEDSLLRIRPCKVRLLRASDINGSSTHRMEDSKLLTQVDDELVIDENDGDAKKARDESGGTMAIRKCKVLLKRMSLINRDEKEQNKENSSLDANGAKQIPNTLPKTPPCRVRLKRIRMSTTSRAVTQSDNKKANPGANNSLHEHDSNSEANKLGKKVVYKSPNISNDKPVATSIYDFLSETKEDDAFDPVTDVIQRLVDNGKAVITRNRKGRPKIKRKVIGKRKTTKKVEKAKSKNHVQEIQEKRTTERPVSAFENDVTPENDVIFDTRPAGPLSPPGGHVSEVKSPDGTFSRLARSVLIQQTNHQNMTRKQNLLAKVRTFMSTPLKTRSTPLPSATNCSPIAPANTTPIPFGESPWRVNENVRLPVAFNFSTNSSNLPSFSSDVIVLAENGNTSKSREEPRRNVSLQENGNINKTLEEPRRNVSPQECEPSDKITVDVSRPPEIPYKSIPQISADSFSSNDSNAENVIPEPLSDRTQDANANIFNLRQMPNPCRGLQHRSPLKPINILEVVSLPRIDMDKFQRKQKDVNNLDCMTSSPKATEPKETSEFQPDEFSISCDNVSTADSVKADNNLFGFEEFIGDENEMDKPDVHSSANVGSTLREKLNKLKNWRPKHEGQQHLPSHSLTSSVPIFDQVDQRIKQRDIKEMFCSTMISSKGSSTFRKKESGNDEPENTNIFEDDEPEITFNEKNPRRSYCRPFKKKRKLRHNFVMFMESDESQSDDQDDDEEVKTGGKRACKRKVQPKDSENKDEELSKFVDEFNDMCKDVEQYNLIID